MRVAAIEWTLMRANAWNDKSTDTIVIWEQQLNNGFLSYFVLLMMIMVMVIMVFGFIVMARLVVKVMLITECWIVIDVIQQTAWAWRRIGSGCDSWYARIVSGCNMRQWMRSPQNFIFTRCWIRHDSVYFYYCFLFLLSQLIFLSFADLFSLTVCFSFSLAQKTVQQIQ